MDVLFNYRIAIKNLILEYKNYKGVLKMGLRMLKGKRMIIGLTQADVAKKLGINVKSYNFKENGKSKFTLKELRKMSEIFNFTEEEIREIFLIDTYRSDNKME